MIKQQQLLIRGELKESTSTASLSGLERAAKPRKGPVSKRTMSGLVCIATRCGRSPTYDSPHCPARDAVCHKCSNRGHFKAILCQ